MRKMKEICENKIPEVTEDELIEMRKKFETVMEELHKN